MRAFSSGLPCKVWKGSWWSSWCALSEGISGEWTVLLRLLYTKQCDGTQLSDRCGLSTGSEDESSVNLTWHRATRRIVLWFAGASMVWASKKSQRQCLQLSMHKLRLLPREVITHLWCICQSATRSSAGKQIVDLAMSCAVAVLRDSLKVTCAYALA